MGRPGGHFFEEFLIETKGARTMGKLPAGPNNYPAPSLGPIGEKKATMSRPGGLFFEEFLMETLRTKTMGKLPTGLNNYPAPIFGPIGEKKWQISNRCSITRLQ